MCNFLHKDSTPIKKEGKGWKIFESYPRGLYPVFNFTYDGPFSQNHSNVWDEKKFGEGFCFFLRKREANRLIKKVKKDFPKSNFLMKHIKYKNGLGKHIEKGINEKSYSIAICKEFVMINKEDLK